MYPTSFGVGERAVHEKEDLSLRNKGNKYLTWAFAWMVLVPRRAGAVELFDLSQPDRSALMEETTRAAQLLKTIGNAAKINVGALGHLVPQLHVHVVARNPGDPAWPGPVWGHSPAVPDEPAARDEFIRQFLNAC